LVVGLLAARKGDLQLCPAVPEVQAQRHDRGAGGLRLAQEIADLLLVQEQPPATRGVVVPAARGSVVRDVGAHQPEFISLGADVRLPDADVAGTDRLYLSAE
jgi:hypothetical protein